MKTPVALLLYNRPATTRRVFQAIARAEPSHLLLVADGPKGREDVDSCAAARAMVEKIDWPCEVERNYSSENLGCRDRVSSGLDWVFSRVEEAIILEDDCLPHPDFFRFCEAILDRYRAEPRIMMASGTNYLLDRLQVPTSYVFSRYVAVWGWAAWRSSWAHYDVAMREWPKLRSEGMLEGVFSQKFMRDHLQRLFDLVYEGKIDTWDVQWFFTCLKQEGLSAVPKANLISNIGLVGTHSSRDRSNLEFPTFPFESEQIVGPASIAPSDDYDLTFFRERFKPSPIARVRRLASRVIHG